MIPELLDNDLALRNLFPLLGDYLRFKKETRAAILHNGIITVDPPKQV